MTQAPGPGEKLGTPEYWDGIDIEAMGSFEGGPKAPVLPTKLTHGAANVLSASLDRVLHGEYEEGGVIGGVFDPAALSLSAGKLVVLERESLKKQYGALPSFGKAVTSYSADPSIGNTDFAEYWRNNFLIRDEVLGGSSRLGNEKQVIDEGNYWVKYYERALEWGVVVATKRREILLASWPFSLLGVDEDGQIAVFNNNQQPYRIPLSIGEAWAQPREFDSRLWEISRVRALQLVHVD